MVKHIERQLAAQASDLAAKVVGISHVLLSAEMDWQNKFQNLWPSGNAACAAIGGEDGGFYKK